MLQDRTQPRAFRFLGSGKFPENRQGQGFVGSAMIVASAGQNLRRVRMKRVSKLKTYAHIFP